MASSLPPGFCFVTITFFSFLSALTLTGCENASVWFGFLVGFFFCKFGLINNKTPAPAQIAPGLVSWGGQAGGGGGGDLLQAGGRGGGCASLGM